MTQSALNEAALLPLLQDIRSAIVHRPTCAIDLVPRIDAFMDSALAKGAAQPTSAVNQASAAQGEVVAWDVYEHRIYGAPGEKRHRVLWVEHYRQDDGTTPDLDWLLEGAMDGGIDGRSKTIHVRPLFYDPPALPALQEPLTCEWWQDESDWDTGAWSSACGGAPWQFEADDPTKNGMRFCIHCGKRMVQRGIVGEQHG